MLLSLTLPARLFMQATVADASGSSHSSGGPIGAQSQIDIGQNKVLPSILGDPLRGDMHRAIERGNQNAPIGAGICHTRVASIDGRVDLRQ